jgi:hypothetical protein
MVYNRSEVVERALAANGSANTPRMCQAWTRAIIGVDAVGDADGDGDADAVDGWVSEPESARHYFDRNPPEGVPVAFSGGTNGFGHRAISIGNGRLVSTDAGGTGIIAIVTIAWIEANWHMKYLGWSSTMSGKIIPTAKQKQSRFDAISWNIRRTTPVANVRGALTHMITKRSPDEIYLYEAAHLYGELDGLGYRVYQLKGRTRGNVLALVRNDVSIMRSRVVRMKEFWVGPLLNRPQKPRIYRLLKIKKRGIVWKTMGVHLPFGQKPRRESVLRIRKVLTSRIKWPTIIFGDFNFNESNVTENIAKPAGAKVAGALIDLAIYMNCELVREDNLGDYGISDHPARYYRFVK